MKKKGSALILSMLMLSFFMTLTLTMYYIARNRNERSLYKLRGFQIDSALDSGSTLAHYELYIADSYVTTGYLYKDMGAPNYEANNDTYTVPLTGEIYSKELEGSGTATLVPRNDFHYTGIVLNNYSEYFGASWDYTKGDPITTDTGSSIVDIETLKQPWVMEERVKATSSGSVVTSRAWGNNQGEKIDRLWNYDLNTKVSIGGYRLTEILGLDKDNNPLEVPLDPSKLRDGTGTPNETIIDLTYEKVVSLDKGKIGDPGEEENYRIKYVEDVRVISNGSEIVINNTELKSMEIEKLK